MIEILLSENKELLREWDWNKNKELGFYPDSITSGSNKKVWWKCSKCGYEWQAKVCNRSNGRSCPLCANKVVIAGINDLATANPGLAAEWHPSKNGERKPTDYTSGSGKKVWWLCPKGHSYQATILHRSQGTNCPICNSGRQTSFAEQAVFFYIKKIFPDAVNRCTDIIGNRMELDIYIPDIKTAIEYDGSFWHKEDKIAREKEKYRLCHEKGLRLIRIKENVFESDAAKDTADEIYTTDRLENNDNLEMLIRFLLDKLDPDSNFWTRKNPTHIHSMTDVDIKRDRFEIMKYRQEVKKNSLASLYPDIAAEWDYEKNGDLKPTMFLPGSSKKVWWKCRVCGHEWETDIYHRTDGTGCPACYRRNEKLSHPEAVKIYQYSEEGQFIKEWISISEAARQLNINASNISMCANHQRAKAGGFRWEKFYKETLENEQLSFL